MPDQENKSDANKPSLLARNYNRAAWFYETSANIYSTGQIKAAKVSQLKFLEPGQSILYLGVGAGEDALRAARKGLKVTCIDISQKMLDRLGDKLQREKLNAELICEDAFLHQRWESYDAVATNFFLNCFKREAMRSMMQHAIGLLRQGGYFCVADVSPPVGSLPAKVFNVAYSKWAMTMFWAMRLVPWHENYDYANELQNAGLQVETTEDFRLAKFGPVMFRSVVARKIDAKQPGNAGTNVHQIKFDPHIATNNAFDSANRHRNDELNTTQNSKE